MSNIPLDVQTLGPKAISLYEKLLSEGQTPKFAEMCVTRTPPGVRGTDRALMQHRLNSQWLDDLPKAHARKIMAEARAAGINTSGKYYMSGLADKRAHKDPAAWIDSVSDIKRVATKRNLTVQGIVEHKGTPMPPPPTKRLSERLTKEMMAVERKENPKLREKKDGEVREMVVEKYGRKPRK